MHFDQEAQLIPVDVGQMGSCQPKIRLPASGLADSGTVIGPGIVIYGTPGQILGTIWAGSREPHPCRRIFRDIPPHWAGLVHDIEPETDFLVRALAASSIRGWLPAALDVARTRARTLARTAFLPLLADVSLEALRGDDPDAEMQPNKEVALEHPQDHLGVEGDAVFGLYYGCEEVIGRLLVRCC